jgi:hypothetical protein
MIQGFDPFWRYPNTRCLRKGGTMMYADQKALWIDILDLVMDKIIQRELPDERLPPAFPWP